MPPRFENQDQPGFYFMYLLEGGGALAPRAICTITNGKSLEINMLPAWQMSGVSLAFN